MDVQKILDTTKTQIEKAVEDKLKAVEDKLKAAEDKLKAAALNSRPCPEGLEVFPDAAEGLKSRTAFEKREFRTYLETAVVKGKLACKDAKNCQKYLEEMHAELKKAYKFFNYFA